MKKLLYIFLILTATTAMAQSPTRGGGNNQLQSWYGGFKTIRLFNPPFTFNPWATYDSLGMVWIDSTTTKKLMWHTGVYRRYVASEHYVDSLFATAVTGVTQQTLDDSCAAIRADISGGGTDSFVYSTKAYRQKGIDSVNGTVALKVSKSDSFPTTGYTTRARLQKIADSINAIIAALPTYAAGWGLTGSFRVDSYAVASRARLQKVADSVSDLIPDVTGYVPYTGATANVDLGVHTLTTSRVHADTVDAKSSMGLHIHSNNHTGIMTLGAGGGSNITFDGYPTTTIGDSVLSTNSSGGLVRYDLKTKLLTKVNYTDTAAMLLPYQRTVNATSGTVTSVATGYGVSGGTITTSGTISSDTAAMATRSRVQKAVDSLNISIGTKGSGTVTSVATNTGTGITGGTITGTGTVAADTTLLNTRAWRQKAVDSLNAQDALRVKYTDTATMLTPYARTAIYYPADTTISAAYTLTGRDFHRTIHCTNGSNIALTIPTGLGTTFVCVVLAEGAGTVTPTTSSTTFYYQPTSTTKIKSQGGATIRSWATANSYLIIGSLE